MLGQRNCPMLCWIEVNGSMLGPRIGSFVGFWMPKTNLAGKKKANLAGVIFLAGMKNLRPDKN